jgi:hypothetical protein
MEVATENAIENAGTENITRNLKTMPVPGLRATAVQPALIQKMSTLL